jgi:hypothetical protein
MRSSCEYCALDLASVRQELKVRGFRPVIGILYILNYIDRQNLSAAKVQGIMTDLNLTTQQFATAVSILFGQSMCLVDADVSVQTQD